MLPHLLDEQHTARKGFVCNLGATSYRAVRTLYSRAWHARQGIVIIKSSGNASVKQSSMKQKLHRSMLFTCGTAIASVSAQIEGHALPTASAVLGAGQLWGGAWGARQLRCLLCTQQKALRNVAQCAAAPLQGRKQAHLCCCLCVGTVILHRESFIT